MDLARLGLVVDARGALGALARFTGSAHNAGREGERLERTTRSLGVAFGSLAGYFGTRQLVEYADTWRLIGARINLVTDTQAQNMAIQSRLYEIAQRTRNTMAATSVLYTRVALNADQLGRSHNELLGVVSAVNSAMLISGATGVEAAQAMRQLSQAMGAGRLQGDEFRTVMEAMPAVARAIADEMGVAMGELYKLSREGKISVQVIIDALLNQQKELEEAAAGIPITIGQSMTIFQNSVQRMIGILNEASDASGYFSRLIVKLSDNMDKIVAAISSAIAMWVAYRAALLGVWAWQRLVAGAEVIRKMYQMAAAIRSAGAATAFWSMVSKGVLGLVAAVGTVTIGIAAYKTMLDQITAATNEWANAQANLDDPLGTATTLTDEEVTKRRHEMTDMVRLAEQQVILAGLQGREEARMAIVMDAVNKKIEARRELTGDLLDDMIEAINKERDFLLQAEEVRAAAEATAQALEDQQAIFERFAENVQRSFGEMFFAIFEDGISRFSELFESIKRMFLRMVAEMAAAKMMQKLGASMASVLAGTLAGVSKAAAVEPVIKSGDIIEGDYNAAMSPDNKEAYYVDALVIGPDASKSLSEYIAAGIGPAMVGFGVGGLLGGMTTNRGVGTGFGAMGGAAAGFAMGGGLGAAIGGLTGAIGGLMGATEQDRQERERHREILRANNLRLEELRNSIEGGDLTRLVSGLESTTQALMMGLDADMPDKFRELIEGYDAAMIREIQAIADELNIDLDAPGAYQQLHEAIELTIVSLTQFGRNLTDITKRQDAYNKLFDVEDTGAQQLKDTLAVLNEMSPELMRQLGLSNLNLDTEAGREVLLNGLREIFNMIVSGELTPELLGAFTDKNQLLDAILRVKDGLDAFHQELYKVTTDFPRAMDIIYYEQKFGRYGGDTGTGGLPNRKDRRPHYPGEPEPRWLVQGDINITTHGGETGEEVLEKVERAAARRRSRGGQVSLERTAF